jgi:ribose transport system substrate-binding protein
VTEANGSLRKRRSIVAIVVPLLVALAVAACGSSSGSSSAGSASSKAAGGSTKSASGKEVALSDAWVGNLWRDEAISSWNTEAKLAVSQHMVGSAPTVVANNSLSTQASQIQSLIVQHPAAIAIDSASPTALNGAISRACAAGIVVVSYDSTVTAPCAYKLSNNFVQFGELGAQYVAQQLHGKGNVLEVRGEPGQVIDNDIAQGWANVFKKYPGIKVVRSVIGDSVESTAQSAVTSALPSLPAIQGVLGEGGDAVGIYNAFKNAGRPIPVMTMGTSQPELALWHKLQNSGLKAVAVETIPGESGAALWTALDVLQGKKVPKQVTIPFLSFTSSSLDKWLAVTPAGGFASVPFSSSYTDQLIAAAASGGPTPPVPTP